MSSFRRHVSGGDGGGAAAVPVVKLPGTRAWVNGQTLTSTGNRDLDGEFDHWSLHVNRFVPFF